MTVFTFKEEHEPDSFLFIRTQKLSLFNILFSFATTLKILLSTIQLPYFHHPILGDYDTIVHNKEIYSEFNIFFDCVYNMHFTAVLKMLALSIGSFLFFPIVGFFMVGHQLRNSFNKFVRHNNVASGRSNEHWMFVNGLGIDADIATVNAYHLSRIFKKKIELVYHPTHGAFFDLIESVVGKVSTLLSNPAQYLLAVTKHRLDDHNINKIVIIAHSRGCIIVNEVIEQLLQDPKYNNQLNKIEIYTFGSPVDVQVQNHQQFPFYEHFVNERDFIGNLGTLWNYHANRSEVWNNMNVFVCKDKAGHFFGSHYLPELENGNYRKMSGSQQVPRLFNYMMTQK